MKKKLLRIFFAFIMFFSVLPTQHIYNNETTIEASYDLKGYVYFEKPSSWTSGGVMFMIGHSSYSIGYKMTNISGTDIYYYNQSSTWGGATEFAFVDNNGSWSGANEVISSRVNGRNNYIIKETTWKLTGGYAIFTITPSYDGTYGGSYSNLNISIKTSASTGGTAYVNGYGLTSATAASAAGSSKTTASIIKYTNATLTATPNTGYTFDGWYDNSTYSGSALSTNKSYTVENVTEAKTYYAKFSPIKSVVTLNNQNATTTGTTSVTGTYASAMPSITIPTKTGYTFGGYYTATGGSGTQYYNANGTSAKNWDKTSATTLYAKWTANTYTINYNGNGSTSGSTASSEHTYDTSKTLTANGFSRTGYSFVNWNSNANGSGDSYSNEESVINLSSVNGATINLYAQWSANEYTVSFDVNGGNSSHDSKDVAYDAEYGTLPTPTHGDSSYIFTGWFTEASGGTEITSSDIVNIADDHTLYAQWKQLTKYTLTLDPNGEVIKGAINKDDIPIGYEDEFGEPKVVGATFQFNISDILAHRMQYEEFYSILCQDTFPLNKEYRNVREYYEELVNSQQTESEDLFDLF